MQWIETLIYPFQCSKPTYSWVEQDPQKSGSDLLAMCNTLVRICYSQNNHEMLLMLNRSYCVQFFDRRLRNKYIFWTELRKQRPLCNGLHDGAKAFYKITRFDEKISKPSGGARSQDEAIIFCPWNCDWALWSHSIFSRGLWCGDALPWSRFFINSLNTSKGSRGTWKLVSCQNTWCANVMSLRWIIAMAV